MDASNKNKIVEALSIYCKKIGSQNKAANTLNGVSSATISQMINGNWELITDEMWRHTYAQIRITTAEVVVATRGHVLMSTVLDQAQCNSLMIALIGNEGSGKTETISHYCDTHKNAYHLKCADYWNKRFFVAEIVRILGISTVSASIPYMMRDVCNALKKMQNPVIVIDEADKLSDTLLYFLISLYNDLKGACAIMIAGTPFLEKRIMRGVDLNKKGFREIYSRVGRRFIANPLPDSEDIAKICVARGVHEIATIDEIVSDSDCDLRRVDRKIFAITGYSA